MGGGGEGRGAGVGVGRTELRRGTWGQRCRGECGVWARVRDRISGFSGWTDMRRIRFQAPIYCPTVPDEVAQEKGDKT